MHKYNAGYLFSIHALKSKISSIALFAISSCVALPVMSLTFDIPSGSSVVGYMQTTEVKRGEGMIDVGLRYGIGGYEMQEANPQIPYLSPKPGTKMIIPSQFVLPSAPKKDIVINLAEMRLYYYSQDGRKVMTFPIGIGKMGWQTPMGPTTITTKRANPSWVVPKSILQNHLNNGKVIEKVWPPGPKNPLGQYAMNLGFKNIVIHGTPYPKGVGLRSSHGCIRMTNEDVGQLFDNVRVGTPVNIIHEPVKIGNLGDHIFMESHLPLTEGNYNRYQDLNMLVNRVTGTSHRATIDWDRAEKLKERNSGYPEPIGRIL